MISIEMCFSGPVDENEKYKRKLMKMKKEHANERQPEDASKGEMLNETRALLVEFYRPHNEKMFRIMQDEPFLYRQTFL